MKRESYYLVYGLILSGVIVLIAFLELVPDDLRKTVIQEGGPVETASVAGYFICLALLFLLNSQESKSCWLLRFLFLALALRELDFHNRFTSMSLSKTSFYVSSQVPLWEKMAGASLILFLLSSVIYLARKHLPNLIKALKQWEPYAVGALFGILFIGISKTADGFQRRLEKIGISVGADADQLASSIEESLELGIPLFFLVSIVSYCYKPLVLKNWKVVPQQVA